LISYPEDTVVYGWIPFGLALSPQELLRRREEYEAHLNREEFGLTRVVHPQIAFVVYIGLLEHSWLVPRCLALSDLDSLDCPRCAAAWWGPKHITVYSLTGVSRLDDFRDSAGTSHFFCIAARVPEGADGSGDPRAAPIAALVSQRRRKPPARGRRLIQPPNLLPESPGGSQPR
jgi:hypothetical protein